MGQVSAANVNCGLAPVTVMKIETLAGKPVHVVQDLLSDLEATVAQSFIAYGFVVSARFHGNQSRNQE
jgi:hypothetical protein